MKNYYYFKGLQKTNMKRHILSELLPKKNYAKFDKLSLQIRQLSFGP